jgi:hypothetical protein
VKVVIVSAVSAMALGLCACDSVHYRAQMPRPPYCVVGGAATIEQSMDQYGETFTPHIDRSGGACRRDVRVDAVVDRRTQLIARSVQRHSSVT